MRMQRDKTTHLTHRILTLSAFSMLLIVAGSGCSESDLDRPPQSTPTATTVATAIPTTVPTATATPDEGGGHTEIEFGSSEQGGGALALHDIEDSFDIPFSQCLGGSGDECTGGTLVYVGVSPGLEPVVEDDPEESIFVLDGGTPITLEVVVIDEGLSLRLEGEVVDAVGESVELGETPDLHADIEWVLAIPPGEENQHPYALTLRLTTTAATYSASEEFTLSFVPSEEDHHEE